MKCPTLAELPAPPPGKEGWPWTVERPALPDHMTDGSIWPRISVVTPSFNQGEFLEETIRSVLLQGYPNLEYLVIDGGSTDASIGIINKYQEWIAYWVSEPDRGQASAINKGLARASGDYLAWLNSDDVYYPSALLRVAQAIDAGAAGLLVGDCMYVDSEGNEVRRYRADQPSFDALATKRAMIAQPSCFFARTLYDRAGGLDESLHYALDLDLWLRFLLTGPKTAVIDNVLSTYRLHESSKTVSHGIKHHAEAYQQCFKYVNARGDVGLHARLTGKYAYFLVQAAANDVVAGNVQAARRHLWQGWRLRPSLVRHRSFWATLRRVV